MRASVLRLLQGVWRLVAAFVGDVSYAALNAYLIRVNTYMKFRDVISERWPFVQLRRKGPCAAMIRAGSLDEPMTVSQLARSIDGRRTLLISESKESIAALTESLSRVISFSAAVFRSPYSSERRKNKDIRCIRTDVIPVYSEMDAEAISASITSADIMLDCLADDLAIPLNIPIWPHIEDSLEDKLYANARRYYASRHLFEDGYRCLLIHLESLTRDTLRSVLAAAPDYQEIFLVCDDDASGQKKLRHWRRYIEEDSSGIPRARILQSKVRECPPLTAGDALILAAGDDNYFVTVTALAGEISKRRPVSVWSATAKFVRGPLQELNNVSCHDIDLTPTVGTGTTDLNDSIEASARLLPFRRSFQSLMKRTFEEWVLEQPRKVAEVYMAALSRFKANRPRYVVACSGRDIFVRAIVEAAKELGIPTMDVQAVLLTDYKRLRRPITDWVSVMETMSRDLMAEHFCFPTNRILVSGSPRNDAMLVGTRRTSKAFTGSVLLATQPVEKKQTLEIVKSLIGSISKVDGATLSIKLHPRDGEGEVEYWRGVIRSLDGGRFCRVLPLKTKLSDAVSQADLVAMQFSNSGLESGILGCDVLSIALNGRFPLDFSSQGLAFAARFPEEISHQVVKYLTDESFRGAVTAARERFLELNPQLIANESASTIANHLEAISGRCVAPALP